MRWLFIYTVSLLHTVGTAKPVDPGVLRSPASIPVSDSTLTPAQRQNKRDYENHFSAQRRDTQAVKTTYHENGQIIDWIPINSQVEGGEVASPPSNPVGIRSLTKQNATNAVPMLELDGAERGPEGTVPVLRQDMSTLDLNQTLQSRLSKSAPPGFSPDSNFSTEAVGDHWYASASQTVNNRGGSGTFSIFKAYTQSDQDFSLLQSAIIKVNVPKPGDNSQTITQTVEAGWINYPAQISPPHIFIYYTTNGYTAQGNNVGGWNRDVGGWVQTDSTIFPGTTFAQLSTRGGTQYDVTIRWYLDANNNWWLWVLDRWIGYYPGTLFSANTDAGRSLQSGASHINYYGEIYDSHPQLTTTDMGSGNWPEAGWQQSAYIRNMDYVDTSGNNQRFLGNGGNVVSDTNRYRMSPQFQSSTTWASYMYLGGPGAGGVIDG